MPATDRSELLAIFVGGCLGALARAAVAELAPAPWGTFAVNVAGTFVLGYVITLLQERMPLTAYGHGLVTSELVPTTL